MGRRRIGPGTLGVGVVITSLLVGCAATGATTIGSTVTPPVDTTTTSLRTEPGGAPGDPTTTTLASTTSVAQEEAGPFVEGTGAVIVPNHDGWNDNFVVPGPVVEHDGRLYMFYTGHTYTSPNLERGQVGLATSADGTDWGYPVSEPLFDGSEHAWTEAGVYPSSAMVLDDGTWVIWFSVVPRAFSARARVIGRATAPAPEGPWTVDPEPVLVGGGPGTWNEKGVANPSVIRVGDGYRMYFDGHVDDLDSTRDRWVGLALSDDAVTWTLHDDPGTGGAFADSDPVFGPGEEGEWDGARVMAPKVIVDGDRFVMLYLSSWRRTDQPGFLQDIGWATSDDGLTWQRSDANPIIGNRGGIAFITTLSTAVVDGEVHVYYDVFGNAGASSDAIVEQVAPLSAL